MLFWIIVAVMTAGVCAILLYPLARRNRAGQAGRSGQEAVYRDQLLELDRDLNGGLISRDEAVYARAEIGRRLLAANDVPVPDASRPTGRHPLSQAFIILLLPALGLCLYLTVGRPELPSQPLAARLENPGNDMAVLVAKAERHLAENPNDGKGWDVLAPIYFKASRVGDAELAYRNAIRLLGASAERLDGLAETLIAASGGVVTADAGDVLRQALALQPNDPRAGFYLALALEQSGRKADAKAAFEKLAAQAPAGAPWLQLVNEHIASNSDAPASQVANGGAQAPGNPTADAVAAAQSMDAGDRREMIRGMVASLDARLKENPENIEGWLRLVRSYVVLDEKEQATDALRRGLKTFPQTGNDGQRLVALAGELGLKAGEMEP